MTREPTLPYWLAGGTETCACCTHTHVLEVERRCTGCDRGFCEHCVTVVRETREVLCDGCRADAEEEG